MRFAARLRIHVQTRVDHQASERECRKGRRISAARGRADLERRSRGKHTPPSRGDLDVDVAIDDPFDPPSLKHAKVLRAEVDGREVAKANWTIMRQSVVAIALGQANNNLRRLLEVCPINAVDGIKKDEGYTYYENLGVSIQGQDANHAWQVAAAPARALGVSVKVWFQWRTKPDAAYPGKWSLLSIG